MPIPSVRAATSFLDELQRDLLETEDQDFDGFFDRWSAAGVPEIDEYRGDRIRSRGEVIAEVGKTRRAIEKRPEILREAETDDSPILTGARRIARGADVLEGMMGNGGNGAPTLIPVSGPAPDATSFATPEFAPAAAPENSLDRADLEPEAGATPRIDDGFATGLSDAEDRAGNDATVDAGAGMSKDEKLKKCESLQVQGTYWVQEDVAQTREMARLKAEIEKLKKQGKRLFAQIAEHIGRAATPTRGDDSTDAPPRKGDQKSAGGGRCTGPADFGNKTLQELLGRAPDISEAENKKESLDIINEKIAAFEKTIGVIKSDQVVTRELIAYAKVESDLLECPPFNFGLGYPG